MRPFSALRMAILDRLYFCRSSMSESVPVMVTESQGSETEPSRRLCPLRACRDDRRSKCFCMRPRSWEAWLCFRHSARDGIYRDAFIHKPVEATSRRIFRAPLVSERVVDLEIRYPRHLGLCSNVPVRRCSMPMHACVRFDVCATAPFDARRLRCQAMRFPTKPTTRKPAMLRMMMMSFTCSCRNKK